MIFEYLTPTDAWHLFKLYELTETARQNSDPEFPELLNRVRFGEQTLTRHFRSYMTNHLVGKQNVEEMNNATNTIFTIYAVDGRVVGHTGVF